MILSQRFLDAYQLAFQLHEKQYRKGTEIPYLAHLMAVASIVLENGGNEDEAIAALLHDAVEDQGGKKTLELIRGKFGDDVAGIVWACSDASGYPKPPWRQRKEKYLAHLLVASSSVRLVSIADKLHNARSILRDYELLGEDVWRRFNGGREGTLWYYRSLVQAYRSFESSHLVGELEQVVTALERAVEEHQR